MNQGKLLVVALAGILLVSPVGVKNLQGGNIATQLRPSSFNATNGDTVWASCKITNTSGSDVNDATLTFSFGREFMLQRSSPESKISGTHALFDVRNIKNGESQTFKVWAKINAPDALTGSTLPIDSVLAWDTSSISNRCSIIMIAHNVYPDLIGELRETHRINGTLDYNLTIIGGYPPYEYYIDWGDGNSNRGGLRQEGTSEVTHSYELPGEYRINAYINDYLGKQVAIRKRIYLEPWGGL